MASQVTVIADNARRVTIKTTPGKHLSDVLQEACQKLGRKPDGYGLKHNNKTLDLSLIHRLSGLPPGAQLELVQTSRSPSVINVALQLPESDQNARITDKIPSNTSLWQLLRRFESGIAGSGQLIPKNLNLTQRATPDIRNGQSGSGRLVYEMPVLNIMGRELGTFFDLQKTLAQLGLNSGSVLIRLTFKNTGQPLEAAMEEISQYFKDVDTTLTQTADAHGAHAVSAGESKSVPDPDTAAETEDIAGVGNPPEPVDSMEEVVPTKSVDVPLTPSNTRLDATDYSTPLPEKRKVDEILTPATEPADPAASLTTGPDGELAPNTIVGPSRIPMKIYAAPSSNAPSATAQSWNASDYEPTVDHAKSHQARLNTEGRNRRLLSDKELAEAEKERSERLNAVNQVTIRIRFPDQQIAEAAFGRMETAQMLYDWVRGLLANESQPFSLRYANLKGGQVSLAQDSKRLIPDLKFQGRLLMNLVWDENVPADVKKQPVLKSEFASKAEELKVTAPVDAPEPEQPKKQPEPAKKKAVSKEDIENKMKKFLKFGKK